MQSALLHTGSSLGLDDSPRAFRNGWCDTHTWRWLQQESIQAPRLWGSKQDVPTSNFLPRVLADFAFNPASDNYQVPPTWTGKLSFLFVLKNGTPGTKVRGYVTGPPAVDVPAVRTFTRVQSQHHTRQTLALTGELEGLSA